MKFSILYVFVLFIFVHCSSFVKEPGRPPKINGAPIEDRLRKIYVHNFQNHTSGSPNVHTMITQLIKSEVDRSGRFLQTREKPEAEYRFYGEISHYQRVGNLLDSANREVSYEITVVVKIELQDKDGNKIPLERDEIAQRVYYSDQVGYRETEDHANHRLLRSLAYRIVEEIENAWYVSLLNKQAN